MTEIEEEIPLNKTVFCLKCGKKMVVEYAVKNAICSDCISPVPHLEAKVKELEAENVRLREALEIYSREENWSTEAEPRTYDNFATVFNWTEKNGFNLAREALK